MLDTVVVGSQESREHPSHRDRNEPKWVIVMERNTQTGKERKLLAGERLQADPSCDLVVEVRRVDEDVGWSVLPPQPRLPVPFEEHAVIVGRDDLGRKSGEGRGGALGTHEHVDVEVDGARACCVHQAKASAPPNARLIRAAARLLWMAIILYARPVESRLMREHRSGTGGK